MPITKNNEELKISFNQYSLEIESKFLTDAETLEKIKDVIKQAAPFIPEPMERDERINIYYDTKKAFHLFSRGFECRGRDSKGGYKHDLKTPRKLSGKMLGPDENDIFVCREYTERSGKEVPYLSAFARGSIEPLLEPLRDEKLVPWVRGYFTRSRLTFKPTGFPDTELEIAFESGYYETADGKHKSKPMYIVELEIKGDDGQYEALAAISHQLRKQFGLVPCKKRKGEMGMEFISQFMDEKHQKKFQSAQKTRSKLYPAVSPS